MSIIPWWYSAKSAERASRWIALSDVIALGILTVFDALAWAGYLQLHSEWELASCITLSVLTVIGFIAWCYGNRAQDLRDKQDAEETKRQQSELAALRHQLVPRTISKDGLETIRRYSGQKCIIVDMGSTVDNDEPADFCRVLEYALFSREWNSDGIYSHPSFIEPITTEPGVGVYADEVDGSAEWGEPIVRDLKAALEADGIQISDRLPEIHKSLSAKFAVTGKVIRIIVGRKPAMKE